MPHDSSSLGLRRLFVFLLNAGSLAALVAGAAYLSAVHHGGWGAEAVILLFVLAAPWSLVGFWNTVIGFVIARAVADPAGFVYPVLRDLAPDAPIVTRTAICLALRNEAVDAVFVRLRTMVESIEASGRSEDFAFHVLSDTDDSRIAQAEERAVAALRARHPRPGFINYRRRADNAGFKAGNLMAFAEGVGAAYDHMIVLDADSVMSAAAMLRLVRAMQADPSLGILQTLVTGRPADNAFARIFQFGMRHAMRLQTIASAWWQQSSGPFWGHNAIIRIRPFVEYCRLPVVPGAPPLGGAILSHDQVEAALMRAGGHAVRVIPDEFESWEENPPSLPDFLKRDLRWGQGNLQYLRVLPLLHLNPMGRFQLVNAILMYLGAPVSALMLLAGLAAALLDPAGGGFAAGLAFALYLLISLWVVLPRALIGGLDVALRGQAGRFGGLASLAGGAAVDTIFSLCVCPIMMVSQSLFVAGLACGRRVAWEAQRREGRAIGVTEAVAGMWPQMLSGALAALILGWKVPATLPWALPTLLPCLLAVPFACLTSGAWIDGFLRRHGLCAIPDDAAPATAIRRIAALSAAAPEEAA